MIGVLIGWAFGAFIYFKVMFDWLFRADITIFASALLSLILSATVFFVTGIYSIKLFRYNNLPGRFSARYFDLIRVTLIPFLLAIFPYVVLARLIIFGFSKKLSDRIDIFGYRGKIDEDFILFLLVATLPFILHYLSVLIGTHFNANAVRD